METPSTRKEGNAFERLNDDVLRLILQTLYKTCLHDFNRLESIRARQVKAVKLLLPLGYTSRSFAKLVLPYVWKYVRIVTNTNITNSERSHNIVVYDILKNDNLLFPYGEYLKELEINFTVCDGDDRYHKIPFISLLQVLATRCTSVQQLNFQAKVENKNKNYINSINSIFHDINSFNRSFQGTLNNYPKAEWNNFKNSISKAFGQGSLIEVTLSSNFLLMDDECLINITQKNPGIRKLSLRGPQFTHRGIEEALQHLSYSLKELEIYNLLGDGSTTALGNSPLSITIDSLLRQCPILQSIHLVGIKYRPAGKIESNICCPLQSITANQVDEETLKRLFSVVNKQALIKVNITSPCDVIKWDSFLLSSILPFATYGTLETLILLILRCQNHRFSNDALNSKIIMKNIMDTLKLSENTVNLLCSKLKEWRILVGKDTDQMYSVESEGVDFVSKTCILDYDRLALSEYY